MNKKVQDSSKVIQVDNLRKSYKDLVAVDDISLKSAAAKFSVC